MIKSCFVILIIITGEYLFAQSENNIFKNSDNYQLEIYYKTLCDGKILKAENFTLERNSKYYYSQNGICSVDQKGYYLVHSNFENIKEDSIYIQSEQLHIDTLPFYKIHIGRGNGIPPWPYYECCDKRCDGQVIEYWDNGIVKIIGKFRDGEIIEMSTFNTNGIIIMKTQKSKVFNTIEYYDEGRLIVKLCESKLFAFSKIWDKNKNKFHRRLIFNT